VVDVAPAGVGRYLAQVNVARLRAPLDATEQQEFRDALALINMVAEEAAGFIWRHSSGFGHLTGEGLLGDSLTTINLSVWESYQHLHDFTYRSAHAAYLRRRGNWFTPLPWPTTALWWLPAGQTPSPAEAVARLDYLRRYGPTPQAFTVRRRFTPGGHLERAPSRGGRRVAPRG
jgi:hypothetical protein